jgi:hypothetical protein
MERHTDEARAKLAYNTFRGGFWGTIPCPVPHWDEAPTWVRDAVIVAYLQGTLDGPMDRFERVEAALSESVKLQSHYARLLNQYDGGTRLQFANAQDWLDRLTVLVTNP